MTHQRTLTAAHWGVYEVEYDDGRQGHAPASLLEGSRSLADRPAHAVRRGDAACACAGRRCARAGWSMGPAAHPERRGQEPFVEVPWDEALDLVAQRTGAREDHPFQPRDLRRLLWLVERRPFPSRAKPGPSLPEFGRRLRAPPGFLQPGGGARADAAHRGADGRADGHAHELGRAGRELQAVRHLRRRAAQERPDQRRRRHPASRQGRPLFACARRACASST